jgi:hypothetical protein
MRWTAILCALAVALLLVALFATRGGEEPPPPNLGGTVPETAATDAGVTARRAGEPGGDPEASGAAADPAPRTAVAAAGAGLATIRGRCVDEQGAALAGIEVHVHGWTGNSERMARHRLEHGEVEWTDPAPVLTGPDGRFEHRFDPPSPFQFTCEPQAPDRIRVYGRWSEIRPGQSIDMGDLVLRPGVQVSGQLVDREGLGLAKQHLRFEPAQNPRASGLGTGLVQHDGSASTDQRGFFRIRHPLPPGAYTVTCYGMQIETPRGVVELALPSADLRIVASPPPADLRPTIEGLVLDPKGLPVVGAQILPADRAFSSASTRRDGRFELKQADDLPPEPVALRVLAEGYVQWQAAEPVAWGTKDLRIELIQGPPLSIRARRADDGTPVERFGITLAPIRPGGGWSSDDHELRHLGDHASGLLTIPRATTGRYRLSVVPPEASGLAPSPEQEIEIEAGVPAVVEVALSGLGERIVEVVTAGGVPVTGAMVELLWHRGGGELTLEMTAMPLESARLNPPDHVAVLVDRATTDAGGRARLRGQSVAGVGLRLPGPGHVPALVAPFDLGAEGIARIVVGAGGRLRGRIEPLDVLRALRLEAGLDEDGPAEVEDAQHLPGVLLVRADAPGRETFPSGRFTGGVPIAADGTFALAGVPPGVWDLHIHSFLVSLRDGRPSGGSTRSRLAAAGLAIADGEERELVLDLSAWRRHEVRLRARLDGEAFGGTLGLQGRLDGEERQDYRNLEVPGSGELVAWLPAGTWSTTAYVRAGGTMLPLPGPDFAVRAGGPALVDIDLRLGRCAVQVLDHEGSPIGGLALHAFRGVHPAHQAMRATDAEGRTVLLGPVGASEFRVRRKPLAHERSYSTWVAERRDDPERWRRAWIGLGTFELLPGPATSTRTIRLPEDWAELPD